LLLHSTHRQSNRLCQNVIWAKLWMNLSKDWQKTYSVSAIAYWLSKCLCQKWVWPWWLHWCRSSMILGMQKIE
jgi:hypothetical protein